MGAILFGILMILFGCFLTFLGNTATFALNTFGQILIFFLFFGGLGTIILGAKK